MAVASIRELSSLSVPVAISPVSISLMEFVIAIPGIKSIIPAIIIILTLTPIFNFTRTIAVNPEISEIAKLLTN